MDCVNLIFKTGMGLEKLVSQAQEVVKAASEKSSLVKVSLYVCNALAQSLAFQQPDFSTIFPLAPHPFQFGLNSLPASLTYENVTAVAHSADAKLAGAVSVVGAAKADLAAVDAATLKARVQQVQAVVDSKWYGALCPLSVLSSHILLEQYGVLVFCLRLIVCFVFLVSFVTFRLSYFLHHVSPLHYPTHQV